MLVIEKLTIISDIKIKDTGKNITIKIIFMIIMIIMII